MKYLVRDCDPNTGEPDDDGYDDEYVVRYNVTSTNYQDRENCCIFTLTLNLTHLSSPQLEDLEVTMADHIQKVLKPNFGAAWEEVGDEFEKEETFALASVRTLEGANQKIEAEAMNAQRFAESVRRFGLCRE